ncbi:MAG: hypothetical protein ABWY13_20050 [Mesorhizobium sp.]|jgi:hypothetical protein|nr:hypothetical protein [Mesorhizobium sp.]
MKRVAATALLCIAASAVAGCSSTEQTLDPSAITPPQQASPAANATASITGPATGQGAAAGQPAAGQTAAVVSNARVQIAPLVGTTVEAAAPLTQHIAKRARERGIALAGSGDASTTHVLKGYFSAISEGRETTVIYVWDVLDPSGNRLHRIQGQQKTPTKGEGWASVTDKTMQGIADRTIDDLAAWLSTRAG